MGSNSNVTTSSTTLPGGITDAINAGASSALQNYSAGNPFAGQAQPVAPLNDWQNQSAAAQSNLTGYTPQQVSTGYNPQQVTAGSVAQFGDPNVTGAQIQNYMNPYTSSVISTSLDQLNRQLAQTNQMASGQAASAGAFGGDRAAIVQSENARNANQIAAQTIAGLNSQNYSQASAMANQNAARLLQAGTAQAQLGANVDEANQYAGLQAANLNSTNERANQQAGLAGAGLRLSAAGQLGNTGAQFRGATQDQLNSIYATQMRDAYYPQTSLSTLAGQIGTFAGASPRTTTQVSPGPSVVGQAAGLGTAALGLNSLIPGGITGGLKSLFGSGSGSSSLGGTFDTTGGSWGSGLGDFGSGGTDLGSYDFSFARGGEVGYADGGETYAPLDVMIDPVTGVFAPAAPTRVAAQPLPSPLAQAPVNTTPPDGTDAPMPAGNGVTANLGIPAQNTDAPVGQALAVNPATIVQKGLSAADASGAAIPVDQMPAPPADGLAAAAAQSPSAGNSAASVLAPAQGAAPSSLPQGSVSPQQGGLADAAPADRITRSADPSASIPVAGLGATTPTGDWTDNKLGMTLLNAGLGMMASGSKTALGAIGAGGLAGVNSLQSFEANRAAQMKNDLTQATLPMTLQALTGNGQSAAVSDPGQAEVLRIRGAMTRAQVLGDGKQVSALNEQLLQIAKDGRVTGADGKVYMVPNARQLAFGVNSDKDMAGVPAKTILNDHETQNRMAATNAEQMGSAAGAEPITTTVLDQNGNPQNVVLPRLQWRQQNLANNMTSPDQFLSSLIGRENPGGNPAQMNLAGSQAMGNGQFIPSTWLSLFKQSYPEAAAKMSDNQILGLRANPNISADMTLRNAQANKTQLEANGLPGTGAALGLAHQFGPDGALKIASADANTPVNVALGVPANDPVITQNRLGGVTTGQIAGTMARTYGTNMVALPGMPSGTMQGAPYLSPEQKTLEAKRGDAAAEIADAGRKAPDTMSRLDVLQNAFDQFRPGVSGPARAQASKVITDLFQTAGMTPPDWAVNGATASDTITKEGGQLTAAMTRSLGSREAASVFNSIREFTPNLSMSNGGFQVVLNSLRQGVQRDQDMANFQEQWLADPRNHGSTAGMQQAFNKEKPIETYASRVTPYPAPSSPASLKDGVIYRSPKTGQAAMWDASSKSFQPVTAGG